MPLIQYIGRNDCLYIDTLATDDPFLFSRVTRLHYLLPLLLLLLLLQVGIGNRSFGRLEEGQWPNKQ
jgi:hypothetical protein